MCAFFIVFWKQNNFFSIGNILGVSMFYFRFTKGKVHSSRMVIRKSADSFSMHERIDVHHFIMAEFLNWNDGGFSNHSWKCGDHNSIEMMCVAPLQPLIVSCSFLYIVYIVGFLSFIHLFFIWRRKYRTLQNIWVCHQYFHWSVWNLTYSTAKILFCLCWLPLATTKFFFISSIPMRIRRIHSSRSFIQYIFFAFTQPFNDSYSTINAIPTKRCIRKLYCHSMTS